MDNDDFQAKEEELLKLLRQKKEADRKYNEARNKGFDNKAEIRIRELIVEVVEAFFGKVTAELVDRLLKKLW